jgi:predicted MPP superfamily phosphohydrolase
MNEALELLGGIKSTCGTYYVLGNHDLSSYTDSPNYTPAQLRSAVSRSGITLLEDAAVRITPDVLLVGRRDAGGTRAEIGTLLNGADRDAFILVADHQPRDFAQEEAAGVDLTLSGHTHGGQIWPLGLLSQPLGFNDLCYGTMQHGSFQAIVTSGLSGWGYPIRTEHHSEYVLITVTPAA